LLSGPGLNDNAFIARLLSLPSESYIGQQMAVLDVVRVHKARKALKAVIGKEHRKHLERVPIGSLT
jgi:aminopeptidase N